MKKLLSKNIIKESIYLYLRKMNILALPLDNYDPNFLYCLDSKPNLIMNGNFTKINYTHPHFTMNGLFILVPITSTFIEHSSENTNFVRFDPLSLPNKSIIDRVIKIEHDILSYYSSFFCCTKSTSLSMTKQFSKGKLKINGETNSSSSIHTIPPILIILKISGVWETEFEYGITFRWIEGKSIQ